ncbi:MAG: ribosome recycling factor [Ethanoligenens sp.]|uniref:ribosome recycling factor n=1 Tax=Ethanoligenens sp. TaxID=2099655 RepID=UPI0039EC4626
MAGKQDYQGKMTKTVAALESEYSTIRAGRANPAILDKVRVDYYGTLTPINQIAAVSITEARNLTIQPWDVSQIRAIEKAILTSDLDVNPQNDGKVLRIAFPPLTEERRKELVKTVRKYAEDAKVAIRSIRRDAIESLKEQKKSGELTEDDLKDAEKKVQDSTDRFCKEIDGIASKKEKEIMEI